MEGHYILVSDDGYLRDADTPTFVDRIPWACHYPKERAVEIRQELKRKGIDATVARV
jgi:hypothetical protein